MSTAPKSNSVARSVGFMAADKLLMRDFVSTSSETECVSELVDTKSLMSNLLAAMKPTLLATLLDLGAVDTVYCAPRDVSRNGQQHIKSLAVIFSGSQSKAMGSHAVMLVTSVDKTSTLKSTTGT